MSRQRPLPTSLLATLLVGAILILAGPLADDSIQSLLPTRGDESPAVADLSASPAAAEALRAGECDRALADLEAAADRAALLRGLYAHACGRHSRALGQLLALEPYDGPMADWRLWALGDSARQLGQQRTAQAALAALGTRYPDSPLAGPALALGAELAYERQDFASAATLVAQGRSLDLDPESTERLEVVAWNSAERRGETSVLQVNAQRLLVEHPLLASRLAVIESLRTDNGELDWEAWFDPDELLRRAQGLLAADLAVSAVETLERVPASARDRDWTLTMADALTRAERGSHALELLADLSDETTAQAAQTEWLRARAALEASVARRGRSIRAEDRRAHRQDAHRHLRRVVDLGADPSLSGRALRILFADLADEDRFDHAVEILQALRQLDEEDETGATYLWRRGWSEFERRNHSSAIGYWAELRGLYPDSTAARRALYWSGRAHRELGNPERAQELLRLVVAEPVADFYHRHAMEWLVEPPPPSSTSGPAAAWPTNPLLARARWLSDQGLDAAARTELRLVAPTASSQEARALLAEILARQGETRNSIIELRRAFPELGTHHQHRAPAAALRLYYPLAYDTLVHEAARRQSLPAHLVFAMIRQESAFDSGAHSRAGARGLMQVMPATGRELASRLGLSFQRSRLVDPGFSVQLGTAYYRQVLRSLGDEELALAGYNAGPTRIRRLWDRSGDWAEMDRFIENLPFDETRTYVQRIVLLSNSYRELYAS